MTREDRLRAVEDTMSPLAGDVEAADVETVLDAAVHTAAAVAAHGTTAAHLCGEWDLGVVDYDMLEDELGRGATAEEAAMFRAAVGEMLPAASAERPDTSTVVGRAWAALEEKTGVVMSREEAEVLARIACRADGIITSMPLYTLVTAETTPPGSRR
jgi:hypothetical protein